MSFNPDLLDDILPQPSNAPERALGKFLPKVRRKNEKVVQQSLSFGHPVQDDEKFTTVLAPEQHDHGEHCMDMPGSPFHDPNSNDLLQRDGENSVLQTEVILPEFDSLDDILPELATTSGNAIGKFQPKVRPRGPRPSKLVPLSSGLISTTHSVSCDAPIPSEKTRVLSNLEALEDGAFEASETPLSGAAASRVGDLQADQGPSEGEKIAASLDMGSVNHNFFQTDVTNYSEAIVPDQSVDLQVDRETLQEEEETELYEDILSQPTLSSARGVGKFQPKLGAKMKKAKTIASYTFDGTEGARSSKALSPEIVSHESPVLGFPPDSSASLEHPTDDVLGENEKASAVKAASRDNCRTLGNSDATIKKNMVNSPKRKSVRQYTSGGTVQSHSQGSLDRGGSTMEDFEVDDDSQSSRRLRKRTSVHTVVNESDDEDGDDWEVGVDELNDSPMPEESSDDEFMGQTSSKKKRRRKSRGSQDEKPTQRPKKASLGTDSSTQEPHKKKFPHSTRRSRRQVDKVLLETPEEDIDPMTLRIKDLIMLAEARERTAVKEAAKKRQPPQDQSDSSFYNNSSLGNDNHEQDLNVDGDEADPTVQFSATKLNYHTYMNRPRSDRWSKVDTEFFYQAVRQFGSDFAMIQQLFPNRTRHQIKLKFKNEERKYPLQIADALMHRSNDHSQFQLVIQRLQDQEEENANADAAEDAIDESQPKTTDSEEEDHVKVDKKEEAEEEVDDWDQGHKAADPNEHEEVFDWSQYDFPNSSSSYGVEKDEYNTF